MAKIDKLLEHARPHLEAGETVDAAVAGTYEAKLMGQNTLRAGVFMATDRRLVFYAKKLGGHELESFPYANISSFEQGKTMMGHTFRFFASGNVVAMKWINGGDFGTFARLVTERAGHRPASPPATPHAPITPAERLRKLENLRADGLISQAEYDAKRAEILSQL